MATSTTNLSPSELRELERLRARVDALEAELANARAMSAGLPDDNVELAPDAMLIYDRDSNIRYINPAGIKMFGGTGTADIVGKSVLEFVHPEFRDRVKISIRENFDSRHIRTSVTRQASWRQSDDHQRTGQGDDLYGYTAARACGTPRLNGA